MRRVRNLTATTFKPCLDKHVAMDGADVVLWCDGDAILILRHEAASGWRVLRFQTPAADDACGIRWCGQSFAQFGEPVASFDEDTPVLDWERFYRECFRAAADAALRRGDAPQLAPA